MDEDKIKEQFTRNLMLGLKKAESKSSGGYNAKNPDSTASGAYQFTDVWMDNKLTGVKSIRQYAKENKNLFNVENPESMTLEDFKNNPELQDAYFVHYSKNYLYPQAKKILEGPNPKNLPIEAVGGLIHFKGHANFPRGDKRYKGPYTGAAYQVRTGDFDEKQNKGKNGANENNMSSLDYLNVVLGEIQNDSKLVSNEELNKLGLKSDEEKEKIVNDFNKRNDEISNNNELTSIQKERKRAELFQEMVNNGNDIIINESKQKSFDVKKKDIEAFKNGETPGGYLSNIIQQNKENFKVNEDGSYELVVSNRSEKELKTIRKKLKEKLPENVIDQMTIGNKKVFETKKYNDLSFSEKYIGKNRKSKNMVKYKTNGDLVIKGSNATKFLEIPDEAYRNITGENLYLNVKNPNPDGSFVGLEINPKEEFENTDFEAFEKTNTTVIDRNVFPPQEQKVVLETDTNKDVDSGSNNTNEENIAIAEKNQEEVEGDAVAQMYENKMGLADIQANTSNYGPTKRDLPVDAAMGLVLGLKGANDAANVSVPMRTEEVSNLVNNYVAELAERKNQGLTPAQEAQANNALAEAYSAGLENLKRNSGGNRAMLLGNAGRLDAQNMRGKLAVQLADIQAKEKAMEMYGQAVQYIDGVGINRDIANHRIQYGESVRRRNNAEQLAASGFKKLIDGVENARLTGPGSAMDMYRSSMMQDMFGFDPRMKDDGSGTVVGTKSYFEKNKMELAGQGKTLLESNKLYQALTPEKKRKVNEFYENNNDSVSVMRFVKTLNDNPQLDIGQMDLSLMEPNSKDYNYLFPEKIKPANDKGIIELAPNQIKGNDTLIERPIENNLNEIDSSLPGYDINNLYKEQYDTYQDETVLAQPNTQQ